MFLVLKQQRLWFSIAGRIELAGYVVNEGLLYVQDGPVLSCWDLNASTDGDGQCVAAINLTRPSLTHQNNGSPLTDAELNAVYDCDAAFTAQRTPVNQARVGLAWIELLSAAETMAASGEPALPSPSGYASFGAWIREALFGTAGEAVPVATLLANAHDDVRQAQKAAGAVLFSAPVVRSEQVSAPVDGVVFVLAGEGRIFSMDKLLTKAKVAQFGDTPALLQLGIYEASDDPNNISCRLCYITDQYALREIDASSIPLRVMALKPFGRSPAKGLPAHPLPLKYIDKHLCGGSLSASEMGNNFFMCAVNPQSDYSFVLGSASAYPYSAYEVDTDAKLVLCSRAEGDAFLQSYGPGVQQRGRWSGAMARYATFWQASAPASAPATTLLMLSVDEKAAPAQSAPGLYARVANTVDTPPRSDPYAPDYLTRIVASVTLTAGAFQSGLDSIGWIRAKPAISRQTRIALLVAEQQSFSQILRAWLTPDPVTGESPFFIWSGSIINMNGQALPVPGGADYLVAYSLETMATQAVPAANTQLQQLQTYVNSVALEITVVVHNSAEVLVPHVGFQIQINDEAPFYVETSPPGLLMLDAKYAGCNATLVASGPLRNLYPGNDSRLFDPAAYSWSSNVYTVKCDDAPDLALDCMGSMIITIAPVGSVPG